MANASVDEIIAIGKQKGIDMSKYEAKLRQKFGQTGIPTDTFGQQPQQVTQQDPSQVASILKSLQLSPMQSVGNAMSVLGGGKPIYEQNGNDIHKLYAQELIKAPFEKDLAQTRSNTALEEAKSLEDWKRKSALDRARNAGAIVDGTQDNTQPVTQVQNQRAPNIPIQTSNQNQPYIQVLKSPETKKWDESLGTFIKVPAEYETKENPGYVKPEEVQSIIDTAQQNLGSIKEAKKGIKYFGPLGGLPTIASPSTYTGEYGPRKLWENNVNQLLSQKVVDLLTTMKRASKTGATGFGQLSDKEGAILREASTALSRDLQPEQALYYLNEMEKINQKILSGSGQQQSNTNTQQSDPGGFLG